MRNAKIFSIIIFLMFLIIACKKDKMEEVDILIKTNNLKLKDLYFEDEGVKTNKIFIEENGEMISYIVTSDDYNGNCLLLREFLLDKPMRFNTNILYSAYYEDSEMDLFLNGEFYESLSEFVKNNIIDTTIEITSKNSLGSGGKDTTKINRKIFLLSYSEMNGSDSRTNLKEGRALAIFSDKSSRVAYYNNGQAGSWWLRTPNTADVDVINGISISGVIGSGGIIGLSGEYLNGVRPAFCLDANIDIIPREDIIEGQIVYLLKSSN